MEDDPRAIVSGSPVLERFYVQLATPSRPDHSCTKAYPTLLPPRCFQTSLLIGRCDCVQGLTL